MKKTSLLSLLVLLTVWSAAQTVTTYAGKAHDDPENNSEAGSGVDLLNTFFSTPTGICFDNDGKIYISERNKVRAVINNKLYIRAGSLAKPAQSEGYRNATGTQSTFRMPGGMVSNSNGEIFVADVDNHCIRKIAAFGTLGTGQAVTTFAGANPTPGLPGNGTSGYVDGTSANARFNQPKDLAMDNSGNIYVTEYGNLTIRKIKTNGDVSTLAGKAGTEGNSNGKGTAATFGGPWGIAIYDANNVVVTDPWNGNIRMINIVTQEVTTITGSGGPSNQKDGTLAEAKFKQPKGVCVVGGIIYVTDQNTIRAIDRANNSVTTFAGNKVNFEIKDGSGSGASFSEMSDIDTDGEGNLYVTENSIAVSSNVIRKISIDDLAPNTNFSASKTNVAVNEVFTLTDISTGQAATSRTWSITPADYTIESGDLSSKSLGAKCTRVGFYEVSLSVTNDYGTDVNTKRDYISVSTSSGSIERYSDSELIELYPNPASNEFRLSSTGGIITNKSIVNLYTVSGVLIKTLNPMEVISTQNLSNGTYYLTIISKEGKFAKRLVVSHE